MPFGILKIRLGGVSMQTAPSTVNLESRAQ